MTNEITTAAPIRPEPLSIYKLHSPEVVRKWKAEEHAYFDALRKIERDAERKLEDERAFSNRVLTDDEAFALARVQENERIVRDLERQAQAYATEQQKLEALAGNPELAEICTPNPVAFLQELVHWTRRGYELDLNGPLVLGHTLSHVTLRAPKPTKGAK